MSDASNGKAQLLAALRVREHAKRGITTGIVFAIAVYAVFVFGRASALGQVLYLSLLAVLAMTVGAVVTTVLVGVEAYRHATEDDPADDEKEQ
ncbi:DUF7536 family protein [Halorhabdus tiamatea]|uniref:Uncharacterized protein n=1 Tax=Halorhabdus tiamatea SARL4B TaxID=1033806 RepID=F7PNW0_9EURY|nr:hypothetical protein [Halorhabdus tiamatea]CCQ33648.1 hypothetical protein HTIA_1521 [Halorhabdus tiamatea SARL4B]